MDVLPTRVEPASDGFRKNREHREALVSPYNDEFVEQMKEFIPHLAELRFNGGEPFLHKFVYKILDQVAIIKPEIKVTIATNGTIPTVKLSAVSLLAP